MMSKWDLARVRRPRFSQILQTQGNLPLILIIAVLVLVACLLFVLPEPQAFPMGDSYIHFVYARNLHDLGEFNYNPGMAEGIGTTSPLWVLLLTAFLTVGITPLVSARVMGIALLISSGVVCFYLALELLRHLEPRRRKAIALAIGLSCGISGNALWIGLSGMETSLFMTLGLLALWAYSRERWILTGILLGLMVITRIEGLCLAGVLVTIEILRHRGLSPHIFKIVGPVCLFVIPWIAYLQVREGAPIPTSFQGKLLTAREVGRLLVERNPWAERILGAAPLVYAISWLGYVSMYLYGGAALPGPSIRSPGLWEGTGQSVSILSLVLVSMIIAVLLGVSRQVWRRRQSFSLSDPVHRVAVAVVAWTLLHNLAYALWLPQPGAAGRYAPMNHLIFWSIPVMAAVVLRQRWIRFAVTAMVVLLLGSSLRYWHSVYRANVEYMQGVRIAAAQYVDGNCPADKPVAATDLGPIRYFARQRVVDVLGFVDRNIPRLAEEPNGIVNYLLEQEVGCLYAFMPVDKVGINSVVLLGADHDPRLRIQEEASFAVSVEEWALGASAVGNYMPAITVYSLHTASEGNGSSRFQRGFE